MAEERNDWISKLVSVGVESAEYADEYDGRLLLVFKDGSKAVINGRFWEDAWRYSPSSGTMMSCPKFYTAEDISQKVLEEQKELRADKERKIARLERESKEAAEKAAKLRKE